MMKKITYYRQLGNAYCGYNRYVVRPTMIQVLQKSLYMHDSSISAIQLAPKNIDFEEKILLLCFHCKNYNSKFTCPPRIPKLDYKHIITNEYTNALLVYIRMEFTDITYQEIRSISTNKIHKALLYLEKILFEHNIATPLSLIGGSCKLCKSGCPPDRCNNPYQSRIPMEATGINVVTTVKKLGLDIKFPVTSSLYRCGLILW